MQFRDHDPFTHFACLHAPIVVYSLNMLFISTCVLGISTQLPSSNRRHNYPSPSHSSVHHCLRARIFPVWKGPRWGRLERRLRLDSRRDDAACGRCSAPKMCDFREFKIFKLWYLWTSQTWFQSMNKIQTNFFQTNIFQLFVWPILMLFCLGIQHGIWSFPDDLLPLLTLQKYRDSLKYPFPSRQRITVGSLLKIGAFASTFFIRWSSKTSLTKSSHLYPARTLAHCK